MDWIRVIFRTTLAAWLGAGVTLYAQEAGFLTPPAEVDTSRVNAFMKEIPHPEPGSMNFTPNLHYNPFAMPPPQRYTPEQMQKMQHEADKRNNWMLMTPEEILDIPTPEKIMGLPLPKEEANLSAAERYVRRLDQARHQWLTNSTGGMNGNPDKAGSLSDNLKGKLKDGKKMGDRSTVDHWQSAWSQDSGYFRNFGAADDDSLGQSVLSRTRDKSSGQATDFNKATARDVNARRLNQEKLADRQSLKLSSSVSPNPAPLNSNFERPPEYNPLGSSYKSLADAASRPVALKPVLNPLTPTAPTPPKRKALVELPPWVSQEQKPNGPLQRKF